MLNPAYKTLPDSPVATASWAIHVQSIGQSGAGLVKALKQISPLSEQRIAGMLYQAPTKLFEDLPKSAAEEIQQLLEEAGLECAVVSNDTPIASGSDDHEVALVVKDVDRLPEVAQLVMQITGADQQTVRQLLFTSPTVLLGKISENTALTIQKRFAALGVEVDISQPEKAVFDVFLGHCSALEIHQTKRIWQELGWILPAGVEIQANSLLSASLSREQAIQLWNRVSRSALPIRIVNRDFERFDVELTEMPATPQALEFLVASTGMPEQVAEKVLQRLPIITHQQLSFIALETVLAQIQELGGKAKGNLLVFQTFDLEINQLGDKNASQRILQVLGRPDSAWSDHRITGPFSSLQARWLQYELKKVGTQCKRILR